jgi:predicted MFS family arabinose efflux permease
MSLGAYLPWTRGIIGYFAESRGLAIAAAMCGASLSGVVTPLMSTYYIAQFGWRVAYVGIAATLLAMVLPVTWFLFKEAPEALNAISARSAGPQAGSGDDFTVRQALRSYQFWLMSASFLIAGGTLVSVGVHLIPLLIDRGLSPMQAAGAMSFMSVGALCGRLSSGYLLDRMPAPILAAITFSFAVVACVVLSSGLVGQTWLYVAATLFGVPIGASPALIPFLSARCFGLTNYGAIYGLLQASFNIGGASLPPILGWLYERDHNYGSAIVVIAVGQILSAVSLQFLGQYRRGVASQPAE